MKKLFIILFPLLFLWGCMAFDEMAVSSEDNVTAPSFSIEEAKDIFEVQYSRTVSKTKSMAETSVSMLSPGDFTPQWEDSRYSELSGKSGYDVPIIADKKLYAVRVMYYGNDAKAYKMEMPQRLLVMRDKESGTDFCYIQTLVPEKNSAAGSNTLKEFVTFGQTKGGFSGLAIYTIPASDKIVRVSRYIDGKKVCGVFLPGDVESYQQRQEKATDLLNDMRVMSNTTVRTRFGEYDDPGGGDDTFYGGELDPAIVEAEYPDPDEELPDPELGKDDGITGTGEEPDPNEETSNLEGDNTDTNTEENRYTPDDYARGKEGLEKMQGDLERGDVKMMQYVNGALSGLGTGLNANGIILSAAEYIDDFANDPALGAFGKSLGFLEIGIGGMQTIIAVTDDEEMTASDWLNILSTAFGAVALCTGGFPIVSGTAGIMSGVLGLISTMISEQYAPGWYQYPTPHGGFVYIYIGNNVLMS